MDDLRQFLGPHLEAESLADDIGSLAAQMGELLVTGWQHFGNDDDFEDWVTADCPFDVATARQFMQTWGNCLQGMVRELNDALGADRGIES